MMSLAVSDSVQPYSRNGTNTVPRSHTPSMLLILGLGSGMAAIIAGTVFAGKTVAFCSIPLFVIAVVALSFYKPVAALAYYFTYSALEGMYKYLSDFSQVVYVIKPILAVVLLLAWLMSIRLMHKSIRIPPLASALSLLSAWGSLEIFYPTGAGVVQSALTFLIWYLIPLGFYFFSYNTIRTIRQLIIILSVLMIVSTVISAFAIIQYDMGKSWTEAHLPGYDKITQHNWWVTDEKGNTGSTSWSPASTTSYCGTAALWGNIGAVLALGLLFVPKGSKAGKFSLSGCLMINILALLIIGVRLWVIIFALEAVFLFLLVLRSQNSNLHSRQYIIRNFGYMALFVILLTAGYQAAQGLTGGMASKRYEDTITHPVAKFQTDRGDNMTYLTSFVISNPLGVGYQRGTDAGNLVGKKASDSIVTNRETEFNSITADMGLPGLLLLMFVSTGLFIQGWRSYRCLLIPETKILAASLFVLLLGTLISYFGTPVLQGADYFWMIVGTLMAMPALEKRARSTGTIHSGETNENSNDTC